MSESKNEPTLILYVGRWSTTLTHNGATLLLFAGLFAPGIWLDSAAMQWAAGIMWFLWVLGFATNTAKKNRVTIEQARKRLDELEKELAE